MVLRGSGVGGFVIRELRVGGRRSGVGFVDCGSVDDGLHVGGGTSAANNVTPSNLKL